MRVLVCSDDIAALPSAVAGQALAAGWPQAQPAVLPVGEAGAGFVRAAADSAGLELVTEAVDGQLITVAAGPAARGGTQFAVVGVPGPGIGGGAIPYGASSRPLGLALAEVLQPRSRARPGTVYLDLISGDVHDGGAGLLAGLGARADVPLDAGVSGLHDLGRIDLRPARSAVGDSRLVGVLPTDQRGRLLLGLRGITSLRGREAGTDPALLLATDAALARLASLLGVEDGEGIGAAGGVALAVAALGGRLTTGPELVFDRVAGPVDLVVTGCTSYDFASRGGGVVAAAARLAERLLCPCLVVAGEVLIGAREMRTMGVEAAYPLESGPADVTADRLRELAVRVGRSWRW